MAKIMSTSFLGESTESDEQQEWQAPEPVVGAASITKENRASEPPEPNIFTVERKPPEAIHDKNYKISILRSKSSSDIPMEAIVKGACDPSEAVRMFCGRLGVESRLLMYKVAQVD